MVPMDVTGKKVLVVEDENLIRWAVVQTLTDAGHTVVEATDAATRALLSRFGDGPIAGKMRAHVITAAAS